MNKLIMSAVLFAGISAQAQNLCYGEVQFSSEVKSYKKTLMSCLVELDKEKTQFFSYNQNCPDVLLEDVIIKGLEVGLTGGHDCYYQPGDKISGVIVKTKDGNYLLD